MYYHWQFFVGREEGGGWGKVSTLPLVHGTLYILALNVIVFAFTEF